MLETICFSCYSLEKFHESSNMTNIKDMRLQRIEKKIRNFFQSIVKLEVEDESYNHKGQKGMESHFRIFLISHDFSEQTQIQRHRTVNSLLAEEFEKGLHALSLRLLTPEEFKRQNGVFKSPNCQKGQ